jgi:NitT/TauT family transport system substrate-binding protein
VDSLRARAGVADYSKTDVARIPIRLELLIQDKLAAASLPQPFDEAARAQGCAIVADSVTAGLDPDLFMFYRADLAARPQTHRALWRAVDRARALIARDPNKYRPLLFDRLGFSEEQARSVEFPAFPPYQPTSAAELARASAWMSGRGLISAPATADQIIAAGILP